jgi:hypothetical protein
MPVSFEDILKYVEFGLPGFCHHPTFFGRSEILKRFKYRDLVPTQDLDLLLRLIINGHKIFNIPQFLLKYRIIGLHTKTKTSLSKASIQIKLSNYLYKKYKNYKKYNDKSFFESENFQDLVKDVFNQSTLEKFLDKYSLNFFLKAAEAKDNKNYFRCIMYLILSIISYPPIGFHRVKYGVKNYTLKKFLGIM